MIGGAGPEGLDAALPLAPSALGLSEEEEVRGAPCWRYWYKRKYGCSEGGVLLSGGLCAVSERRRGWSPLLWRITEALVLFWWTFGVLRSFVLFWRSSGALRSLVSVTLRSLVPLQMSDSRAPRSAFRESGRLFDWL